MRLESISCAVCHLVWSQRAYRYLSPCAAIYMLMLVVLVEAEYNSFRQIIDMQELTQWLARPPHDNLTAPLFFGFVESADERWQHVAWAAAADRACPRGPRQGASVILRLLSLKRTASYAG
jgi:hypothetical protein